MSKQNDFYITVLDKLKNSGYFSQYQSAFIASCALAQACVESANFTSSLCSKYNNCIGYKYTVYSKYQIGSTPETFDTPPANFGIYNSIIDCAKELADYLLRSSRPDKLSGANNVQEYANLLKSWGYFGMSSSQYASSMQVYFNSPDIGLDDELPGNLDKILSGVKNGNLHYIFLVLAAFVFLFVIIRGFRSAFKIGG